MHLAGTCSTAKTLWLPVWSLEELEKCRAELFKHVTPATMRHRYTQFGGVPRAVLQQLEFTFQELLQKLTKGAAERLLVLDMAEARSDVRHSLVHAQVGSMPWPTSVLRGASSQLACAPLAVMIVIAACSHVLESSQLRAIRMAVAPHRLHSRWISPQGGCTAFAHCCMLAYCTLQGQQLTDSSSCCCYLNMLLLHHQCYTLLTCRWTRTSSSVTGHWGLQQLQMRLQTRQCIQRAGLQMT